MLYCLYHPTLEMVVVEDEERERLLETGVWFDHPLPAKEMRLNYEEEIENERANAQRENESGQTGISRQIQSLQCSDDKQRRESAGISKNDNKGTRQRRLSSKVKEAKNATSLEDNK